VREAISERTNRAKRPPRRGTRLGTPRPTGAVKRMRRPHGECDAFAASVLPIIREVQAAHHMSRDVVLRTTAPAISNDVDFLPGIRLTWGVGHLITTPPVPERPQCRQSHLGRHLKRVLMDRSEEIIAVFMTQVLPFRPARRPLSGKRLPAAVR
jgi:hypothetical protein